MSFLLDGFSQAFKLIAGLDRELVEIVYLSLVVSLSALLIATTLGLPLGVTLALKKVPLRKLILTTLNSLMGLPPVVLGLFLYLLFSRNGPLGFLGILYTPIAMIIAQCILAFPIVASLTHAAVAKVGPSIRLAATTLGATPFQVSLVVIKEARYGIVAGLCAALGRIMAEVGAILIVGGNIAGYTRVMTTTIAMETDKGNFELALALGIVLLFISFLLNLLMSAIERMGISQGTQWA